MIVCFPLCRILDKMQMELEGKVCSWLEQENKLYIVAFYERFTF